MERQLAVTRLAALAHESRLAVFRMLVQQGPAGLTPGVMAEALGIAPSSLSFHLKELAHADLVTVRQDGRKLIYAANFAGMNALMSFLTDNCCGGNPCTPVSSAAGATVRGTTGGATGGATGDIAGGIAGTTASSTVCGPDCEPG